MLLLYFDDDSHDVGVLYNFSLHNDIASYHYYHDEIVA